MRWELLVSLRYLLAKRKERFISVTTALSVLSVTIGVAALIIVLGVMNGFGDQLREKIVGFNYHIHVEKPGGLENSHLITKKISDLPQVRSASPFIDGQAIILTEGTQPRGILVRGIDPSAEKDSINVELIDGEFKLKDNEIALGNELARLLRLKVGDTVSLISGVSVTPRAFKIGTIFHSGMYDYDANVAFTNINAAKTLFNTKGRVGGIGIRVARLDIAAAIKRSITRLLGRNYLVNTWIDLNKNLFAAIKLEKVLVFIVVMLTIAVGAVNIISTLSLLTLEKTKDIGILKALGATKFSIANIYMFKGLVIGIVGSSLGLLWGLLITKNINQISDFISRVTGFELFSREIYYLDKIPVSVNYPDIWLIVSFAVGLSFLATLYPAWHASRLDPIEALRYE